MINRFLIIKKGNMITTTLNHIRQQNPCADGWEKLLKHLGKTKPDDEPLPYATIVESNGIEDAIWCCRAEPQYDKEWRLFAVWCARQVQHLMKDGRSINAINVAERYANGQETDQKLKAAWAAARDVALDAASVAYWSAVKVSSRDAYWAAAMTSDIYDAKDKQKEKFLEIVS